MIVSFSVPDNKKYLDIINWYRNVDKQERSREFREIFLSYLHKSRHTMELQDESHISPTRLESFKMDRMNITSGNMEEDLDSKLDLIGIFSGGETID